MTRTSEKIVTIKDLARATGKSLATVSYALRASPKISASTRERVLAKARELGYRPNPRVASLMAHIRRAQSRPAGERIAFIWVHTPRQTARRDPFLAKVFAGAEARAHQAGFILEQYWTEDPGMSDRRLEQILRTRGIVGVVLSPIMNGEATLSLGWDWNRFAVAVIGNVTWSPEMHHAGHHHFLGMKLALAELEKLGCKRPAALLEKTSNERAKRAWEAAFLAYHPQPVRAQKTVHLIEATPSGSGRLTRWLEDCRPDALIVNPTALLELPVVRLYCKKHAVRPATLYWSETTPAVAGIDQGYDRIAAHAVDLVISQLNSNETGAPDLPSMLLFPGRWQPSALRVPS